MNKDQLREIIKEKLDEAGMSMAAAKASAYPQYSPAKFLEELDNIDKQIMALRSGNPFKYSGTKTPFYGIRSAIQDIKTAAQVEMIDEGE